MKAFVFQDKDCRPLADKIIADMAAALSKKHISAATIEATIRAYAQGKQPAIIGGFETNDNA